MGKPAFDMPFGSCLNSQTDDGEFTCYPLDESQLTLFVAFRSPPSVGYGSISVVPGTGTASDTYWIMICRLIDLGKWRVYIGNYDDAEANGHNYFVGSFYEVGYQSQLPGAGGDCTWTATQPPPVSGKGNCGVLPHK